VVPVEQAPRLSLNVGRMSLLNGEAARAIQKEWITLTTFRAQATVANTDVAGPRWKHIADAGSVAIFENLRALPRVWLANSERVASGPQQLEIIRTGRISAETKWQPLDEALVEGPAGVALPKEKPPSGRAEITRRTPNRVELATDSFTPSLLVLADNYYPGWRAEVDGRAARIMRVNYNQRGVALPAGRHVVMFSYQPTSVLTGLLVSGLSLVLLLVWMNSRPRESLA
jgi:Bacterial membrane protein YfhO